MGLFECLIFKVVPTVDFPNKWKIHSGAGEMSSLHKGLLHKQKDLGVIPSTHAKKWEWRCVLIAPALGRERQEEP